MSVDPKSLRPGDIVRWSVNDTVYVLEHRLEDDSGWRGRGGLTLSDKAWKGGRWSVVRLHDDNSVLLRWLLAERDEEIRQLQEIIGMVVRARLRTPLHEATRSHVTLFMDEALWRSLLFHGDPKFPAAARAALHDDDWIDPKDVRKRLGRMQPNE